MLECGLSGESAIRARWHVAVRSALSKRIKRRGVVDGIMACWATPDGRLYTAAGGQSRSWCEPPMVEEADSGSWSPDPAAPAPCFSPTTRRSGADGGAAADSDDDVTDLTSDPPGPAPDSPTRTTAIITTAKCLIGYNVDWDGVGGAAGPCLAAVGLQHVARQSVGTSRWWTTRWPQNAVSLVGRADALRPGKTYKLVRALRKHALNYLGQLWMLASDRRHARE